MQAHTDLTKTADEASERPAAVGHSWVGELLLRLLGAALQIVATLAIVSALSPDDAGVFHQRALGIPRAPRAGGAAAVDAAAAAGVRALAACKRTQI